MDALCSVEITHAHVHCTTKLSWWSGNEVLISSHTRASVGQRGQQPCNCGIPYSQSLTFRTGFYHLFAVFSLVRFLQSRISHWEETNTPLEIQLAKSGVDE